VYDLLSMLSRLKLYGVPLFPLYYTRVQVRMLFCEWLLLPFCLHVVQSLLVVIIRGNEGVLHVVSQSDE